MIQANVAEVKAKLSYFLRMARDGERVVICDRNRPIAELIGINPPVSIELRKSAFGLFASGITEEQIQNAFRPMGDEEADAFLDGA